MPYVSFLEGGGEMGELIRSVNWAKTPLGSPHNWCTLYIMFIQSSFAYFAREKR